MCGCYLCVLSLVQVLCVALYSSAQLSMVLGRPQPRTLPTHRRRCPPTSPAAPQVLRRMYSLTGGKLPIVGVGGVASGEDAYAKIRAGGWVGCSVRVGWVRDVAPGATSCSSLPPRAPACPCPTARCAGPPCAQAGASLVELYSAFAFEGPRLVPRVKAELAALLERDGYACVADAVGADHKQAAQAAKKA